MTDITLTSRTGKEYAHRDRDGFLVPVHWSETPCKILAEKYRRKAGVPHGGRQYVAEHRIPEFLWRCRPIHDVSTFGAEDSALAVFERMVGHWLFWAFDYGYMSDEDHGRALYDSLVDDLYYQRAAPNSPQWFNTGLWHAYGITGESTGNWCADHETGGVFPCENAYEHPQTSACFINGVTDELLGDGGIMDLFTREARLFKGGSGSGANYSALRAEGEPLSGGGKSSGMMSFLRVGDTNAGAIKSGGTTRRAARNVVVDAEHPDIFEFIEWKAKEEAKVHALVKGGEFDYDWQGEAYRTVQGQNANNNVFMDAQAIIDDAVIEQTYRTTGEVVGSHTARQIVRAIAEANHKAGDPGIMFRDTINAWHPYPHFAPMRASNPCVELMSVDDTACNLASLNLKAFFAKGLTVAAFAEFTAAVRRWTQVLEWTVAGSSYPSRVIAENTWKIRNLGLGYANLGGLLMSMGISYDSDEGRKIAAQITSHMTAIAYDESARMAGRMGTYSVYSELHHGNVIERHVRAAKSIGAGAMWNEVLAEGSLDENGYRNAQVTLLAPTGTIGLLMDCDTTGIEPAFALKTFKSLAGGGSIEATVKSAVEGMRALGESEYAIDSETESVTLTGSHSQWLEDAHPGVFACASGPHALSVDAHLEMMAAVQPFLSGGISKTVNVPNHYTVEDIEGVFVKAAKLGLKAVAVYRDGCKASQPLESVKSEEESVPVETQAVPARKPVDRPAPATVHKLTVAGHTFYVTITRYLDGFGIAEVFISHSRDGGTLGGILNALARQVSVSLQYGVPVEAITKTMRDSKSEPAGFVQGHPRIRFCSSIADLIARVLEDEAGIFKGLEESEIEPLPEAQPSEVTGFLADPCTSCGEFRLVRNGTCLLCRACGSTSGCS